MPHTPADREQTEARPPARNRGAYQRSRDVQALRELATGLPVVIRDEPLGNGERVYRVRPRRHPERILMNGRYHVIAAYLQGWTDARRYPDDAEGPCVVSPV